MATQTQKATDKGTEQTAPAPTVETEQTAKSAEQTAPPVPTDDGFQSERNSWGAALATVHLILLSASLDLGSRALDLLLRVKAHLDAQHKKSQPGAVKSPWTADDFDSQCSLLDNAARALRPDLTSDRAISAAYHVRVFVLAKALIAILGDSVMGLSHNLMANYLCGWMLDFSRVDLETMARESSNPKEAQNRIKTEWLPWIKSALAQYLTDPNMSQKSLIASGKEFKAQLERDRQIKKGVDPRMAELEEQRKKAEQDKRSAQRNTTNSIAKALTGGAYTPQEVIEETFKTVKALGLSLPAGVVGGFDPTKATPQECAIMLAAMDQARNHTALRFIAKASARMVSKLDSTDMTDLLAESTEQPDAPALKIANA
jgi:hypothetical protein